MNSRRLNSAMQMLTMGLCLAVASPIPGNHPESRPRTSGVPAKQPIGYALIDGVVVISTQRDLDRLLAP